MRNSIIIKHEILPTQAQHCLVDDIISSNASCVSLGTGKDLVIYRLSNPDNPLARNPKNKADLEAFKLRSESAKAKLAIKRLD